MAILLAGWAARRWATLPPLLPALLALLLAGCTVPVYLPDVELEHRYDLAVQPVPAPTPPEPPIRLVPLLWTGAASAAAGAGLLALTRRRKP